MQRLDSVNVCVHWEAGYVVAVELAGACNTHCTASKQIRQYLKCKRRTLDFPVKFRGTSFEKRVWKAAMDTAYAHTRTYGDIAKQIGHQSAYRAVGNALSKNPLLIKVPCHRVIKSDGSLGGFGSETWLKAALLDLEGANFKGN